MNKNELADAMALKTGVSKAEGLRIVAALIEVVSETLEKGNSLSLPGFGTFEVRERQGRTGRNPKTGEELQIAASKTPVFRPGSTLKARVNRSGKSHEPPERQRKGR